MTDMVLCWNHTIIARSNVNHNLSPELVALIRCAMGHPSGVAAIPVGLSAVESRQPLDRFPVDDPVVGVFLR